MNILITHKIMERLVSKMEMNLYSAMYYSLKNKCYTRFQNQFNSDLYHLIHNRINFSIRNNLKEE